MVVQQQQEEKCLEALSTFMYSIFSISQKNEGINSGQIQTNYREIFPQIRIRKMLELKAKDVLFLTYYASKMNSDMYSTKAIIRLFRRDLNFEESSYPDSRAYDKKIFIDK